MSVNVRIKNKNIFHKKITLQDLFIEGMRFGIMDEAYRLEEGKIGEYTVIFNAKEICRGYDIKINKEDIDLKMPLPTSENDILFFYKFVKQCCQKFKTKKFIREEEEVTLEEIPKWIELDRKTSVKALKQIEEDIEKGKYKTMYLFGALNPITLGKKELIKIGANLKKLGELTSTLQEKDVYYAKATLYQRKDQSCFGLYVLTENIPTVLPYEPKSLMNSEEPITKDWYLGIVYEETFKGTISYQDFLKSIQKIEEYDTEHFIMILDKKQMEQLIQQYKVEL